MEINLLFKKIKLFYVISIIDNFNLKIHVDYNFESSNINETKLVIDYSFDLYEGTSTKFGILQCTYEFIIDEAYQVVTLNEETENMMVRYCMRLNGNNIRELIKTTLNEEGISIKEEMILN